jgi:hypothetical protein
MGGRRTIRKAGPKVEEGGKEGTGDCRRGGSGGGGRRGFHSLLEELLSFVFFGGGRGGEGIFVC